MDGLAPGADDNASGSAGLLAMARALSGCRFVHDLLFILFGGEEQGLFGSQHYVASLSAPERNRILGVLNMDMIGSVNTSTPSVLLEGAQLSQYFINTLANSAATYTELSVQTSLNPFASDRVPFINQGIPAVLTIEGADGANEGIHTGNDTLDHVDVELVLEILRMNVAAIAALAEFAGDDGSGFVPGKGGFDPVDNEQSQSLKVPVLLNHLQQLIAQYARLQQAGLLQQQDLVDVQQLIYLSETLWIRGFDANSN